MATKTIVTLFDDLTEEPADTTVRFGIDGRDYEIDLTDANATELRDLFARYIPAARKIGGRTRAATSKPAFSDVDSAAVRAWAAANNMTVSPRGRIKGDVLEAYRAAGN